MVKRRKGRVPTHLRRRGSGLASVAAITAFAGSLGLAPIAIAQEAGVLNLKDAEIQVLIDDVAAVTGYTFIVHPQVRGTVTVVSQSSLTERELFEVFLATLRVNGFVAVPAGADVYRIVPDTQATSDATGMSVRGPSDQFATQVFRLRYTDAQEAERVVKPLINGRGSVTSSRASNIVVVVDYADNVSRIAQILREVDQDASVIETVSLRHIPADEAAQLVIELEGLDRDLSPASIAPLRSTNAVVLRGDGQTVARLTAMIRQLDVAGERRSTLSILPLRHSSGGDLIPVLQEVSVALSAQANPGRADASAPVISHHEPTNSLVISADPETLIALENIVRELDVRRPQVQVEALIVEVSDQAAKDLGVQFLLSGGPDSDLPLIGTNFTRSAPNLLTVAGALLNGDDTDDGAALRDQAVASLLGVNGGIGAFGGQNSDGALFGAIINAVQNDRDSNILSTPFVLTLDNEPAVFNVGQEIPITTGEALGSDFANPFRTVDRKDVGVRLEVTPQVSDGDTIRLDLRQEVSSVSGPVAANFLELITNKREIDTTILADDGDIIVLGGLIETSELVSESKVPLLGDLPGVGRLFRSEGTSTTTTNLMVFLRPTIVRDREDMAQTTAQKYDYIRNEQFQRELADPSRIDRVIREVMGAQPPAGPAGER